MLVLPPVCDMMLLALHELGYRSRNVNGCRMHYVDEGQGPPVVMVHGSPVSSYSFRRQITALSGEFRVIAPDLPGFGKTSGPPEGASFTAHAGILEKLLDGLELESFHLVLHDWGGPIGMGAVSEHLERIQRLVLINTTISADFVPPLYWKLAVSSRLGKLLVRRLNVTPFVLLWLMKAARSGMTRRTYTDRLKHDDARAAVLALERLDGYRSLMERLGSNFHRLASPTLIIWGRPDPYFGQGQLQWLKDRLPRAFVKEIAGGGHYPQEDASDAVTDALTTFLT